MSSSRSSTATAIESVHPDVIQTHILTRLDGPTLASTICASSHLRALSDEDRLWKDICNSKWPATANPLVGDTVSAFPSGHRSLYSDCFPTFHNGKHPASLRRCGSPTLDLISAVDIHYQDQLIFSKVGVTETTTGWFESSPLRIELLEPKESVATPEKFYHDEETIIQLEECMSLSWILIDPAQRRAVNVSSLIPVEVLQHWLTGDIQVRFATVMAVGDRVVLCKVEVTCGGKEGGDMQVKEVSMWLEDMDGKILCGKDSLGILQASMNSERRRRRKGDERERYEEYKMLERDRRVRKHRRERRLDTVFTATCFTVFMIFWLFIFSFFLKQ